MSKKRKNSSRASGEPLLFPIELLSRSAYATRRFFFMFTSPPLDTKFAPSGLPSGFASGGAAPQANTVIARGVSVEGDFRSQGNVTIEGELVGSITCSGHLTIGAEASIRAGITTGEATIAGAVEGNITVTHRLELKATARIKGDVLAEALAVESGAILDGHIKTGGAKTPSKETGNVPASSVKHA